MPRLLYHFSLTGEALLPLILSVSCSMQRHVRIGLMSLFCLPLVPALSDTPSQLYNPASQPAVEPSLACRTALCRGAHSPAAAQTGKRKALYGGVCAPLLPLHITDITNSYFLAKSVFLLCFQIFSNTKNGRNFPFFPQ